MYSSLSSPVGREPAIDLLRWQSRLVYRHVKTLSCDRANRLRRAGRLQVQQREQGICARDRLGPKLIAPAISSNSCCRNQRADRAGDCGGIDPIARQQFLALAGMRRLANREFMYPYSVGAQFPRDGVT